MSFFLLYLALMPLNDEGGTVHYFDVVLKQVGSQLVLDPAKPQKWAPWVGQHHSMLFFQSINREIGAPEELYERNPDVVALVHQNAFDARKIDKEAWDYFTGECEECLHHDEDGHRIAVYGSKWNSTHAGGHFAKSGCDPVGDRPGSSGACVVYKDGEVISRNEAACNCQFGLDLGNKKTREFFGDRFAAAVTTSRDGFRPFAGITLDNLEAGDSYNPNRIPSGRISGIPAGGFTRATSREDTQGALAFWTLRIKESDPENIFIGSYCRVFNEDELGTALAYVDVTDGCMAEGWTMQGGAPTVRRPDLYLLQLRTFQMINKKGKYFIPLVSNNFPHDTGAAWSDPDVVRRLVNLAHANVLLAWDNPKGMLSYWRGSAHSAAPTFEGSDTFYDDFPLHDLDCGEPLGNLKVEIYEPLNHRILLSREWTKCFVVVNQSNRRTTLNVADSGYTLMNGKEIPEQIIMPKASAMVFVREPPEVIPDPVEEPHRFFFNLGEASCMCELPAS